MPKIDPRTIRRRILTLLYDCYQRDPLQMLSPQDMVEHGSLETAHLSANCHYLHDRSLIELLVGYNPPLFAAARIAPQGIDLYEDVSTFDKTFPISIEEREAHFPNVIPLMMQLAREAEDSNIEGIKREWLLRDLGHLREELRKPVEEWQAAAILNDLEWLEGVLGDSEGVRVPSFAGLQAMLTAWLT